MLVRFGTFPVPPEAARAFAAHLLQAVRETAGALAPWFGEEPFAAMSPDARQLTWAQGRGLTRDPDYGFHLAERVPPGAALGPLWALCQAGPDLTTLYRHYPDYAVLMLDDFTNEVSVEASSVRLVMVRPGAAAVDRGEEDFRAAFHLAFCRALLGRPGLCPVSVGFSYARPSSTCEHERILGTRALRFSQPSLQLEFSAEDFYAPIPSADAARFEALLTLAVREARALSEQSPLSLRVEALVTQWLLRGPSAPRIARLLGMSARSLHRRLSAEGQSFRRLMQQVQRRHARLIAEVTQAPAPGVTARARAALLGFSGAGALRNAERRWRAI
jgi:AraC-like DNA-binding protein